MNEEYGLGRRLDPETPRAVALYPVRTATSDRQRRTWNQKSAWLNQGSTGCCVGFSFAHRRADGPVPTEGIDEAWAKRLYLEASALYYGEPDTSLQKGTSAISACQVLMRRGAISNFEWVASWNAGPADLRYTLLELGSVLVGSNWYDSMYSPKNGYMVVTYSSKMRGGHEYLINAVDLKPDDGSPAYYRIKNSWGKGWGNGGTARFKLADLERLIFEGYGDAVIPTEVPKGAA